MVGIVNSGVHLLESTEMSEIQKGWLLMYALALYGLMNTKLVRHSLVEIVVHPTMLGMKILHFSTVWRLTLFQKTLFSKLYSPKNAAIQRIKPCSLVEFCARNQILVHTVTEIKFWCMIPFNFRSTTF